MSTVQHGVYFNFGRVAGWWFLYNSQLLLLLFLFCSVASLFLSSPTSDHSCFLIPPFLFSCSCLLCKALLLNSSSLLLWFSFHCLRIHILSIRVKSPVFNVLCLRLHNMQHGIISLCQSSVRVFETSIDRIQYSLSSWSSCYYLLVKRYDVWISNSLC